VESECHLSDTVSAIHGALLAVRGSESHTAELTTLSITPIDLGMSYIGRKEGRKKQNVCFPNEQCTYRSSSPPSPPRCHPV
jgi:hypothetical protein